MAPPALSSEIERVVAYARLLGCPVNPDRIISIGFTCVDPDGEVYHSGSAYYNGIDIAARRDRIPLSAHELLHDIGHWYVASAAQRKLPEFGLGFIAKPLQADAPDMIPQATGDEQELLTWAFSIVVGRRLRVSADSYELGLPDWGDYENWKKLDTPQFGEVVEEWAPIFEALLP